MSDEQLRCVVPGCGLQTSFLLPGTEWVHQEKTGHLPRVMMAPAAGPAVPPGKSAEPAIPPMWALPDNNPKTRVGATKLPLHLVPPVAIAHLAAAMADGATKYYPYNWRDEPISATVYYGAAMRHMAAWYDGEDKASDSGVHHLAHAMTCFAIALDAMASGKFVDDRPPAGGMAAFLRDYKVPEKPMKPRP